MKKRKTNGPRNIMKTIDPCEIFALDDLNWRFEVYHVGNSNNRILIVKKFFRNPDKVREFAKSIAYVNTIDGQVSNIPGYVHTIGNLPEISRPIRKIIKSKFASFETSNYLNKFTFQSYPVNQDVREVGLFPHTDNIRYAGVCSLNKDDEYCGEDNGTALWRRNSTSEEYMSRDYNYRTNYFRDTTPIDKFKYVKCDPSIAVINGWSRYHVIPHSYNTMVFYEGTLWHSPYYTASKWKSDRLTFNCFLD